jgi:hypothetical protein
MTIAFDDIDLPIVETVTPVEDNDDNDLADDAASNAESEILVSEYGGSISELPPWCLFASKECRCIFELGSDKSVFYRVCGNVLGNCKRQGYATGEKAAVGYYEPVKARKFIDGRLNTFLTMEEFGGKEKGRMEAKAKEMETVSARFGCTKESPTESDEELYFQARPVDSRLFAHQPKDHAKTADSFGPRKAAPKSEGKKEIKPSLKHSDGTRRAVKPSVVDTDLGVKEDPGLIQSPTLKKLQATGLTADFMDLATVMMMAMVDQLTTSMTKLTTQVEGIAAAAKLEAEEAKPTKPSPAPKKPKVEMAPPAPPVKTKPKPYYGVSHGLDGAFGVFSSWG